MGKTTTLSLNIVLGGDVIWSKSDMSWDFTTPAVEYDFAGAGVLTVNASTFTFATSTSTDYDFPGCEAGTVDASGGFNWLTTVFSFIPNTDPEINAGSFLYSFQTQDFNIIPTAYAIDQYRNTYHEILALDLRLRNGAESYFKIQVYPATKVSQYANENFEIFINDSVVVSLDLYDEDYSETDEEEPDSEGFYTSCNWYLAVDDKGAAIEQIKPYRHEMTSTTLILYTQIPVFIPVGYLYAYEGEQYRIEENNLFMTDKIFNQSLYLERI